MAYGNNRSGEQPRAHFRLAGGTTIKFKHPYLAGQLGDGTSPIDEVDVSSCCKLEGRFFEANPNQDSAKQTVLIDGSTVTITNKLLNGTITMPIVKTTGLVSSGDFIACLQLIKSVGDTVGGLLYKTDYINGKAITRVYYGVTVQRLPDDVSEGNDVPVYNVQLFYAGWLEAVSATTNENLKKIWAVGASNGIEAFYTPYAGQNMDGESGTGEEAVSNTSLGITDDISDDTTGEKANVKTKASSMTGDKTDYGDVITNEASGNTIVTVETVVTPKANSSSGS